jgi:HEPN domain-containing protein
LEQWEIYLKDASNNIESAHILFDKEKFGHSAYHVQQAVELSIKAFALKFNIIENPETDTKSRTHLPSKLFLRDVYDQAIESFNKINIREIDQMMNNILHVGIKSLDNVRKIMKDVDKSEKKSLKEDLWKISLGLSVSHSRITEYFDEIEKLHSLGMPVELMELQIMYFRNIILDVFHQLRRNHQNHVVEYIKKDILKLAEIHNLPKEFLELYVNYMSSNEMKAVLSQTSKSLETIDFLNLTYGKDGMLSSCLKLPSNVKNDFIGNDFESLYKLIYLTSFSSIAILSFPHEEYGRYSKIIDETTISTELYIQQKDNLQKLLNRSERECQRLAEYLFSH